MFLSILNMYLDSECLYLQSLLVRKASPLWYAHVVPYVQVGTEPERRKEREKQDQN
jgi:hypothetical protein